MDTARLTVIVACHDLAGFIADCLKSVLRQPRAREVRVIVVDDGSRDGSADIVRAEFAAHPEVDCELIVQANEGVGGARNAGLQGVRTPYVTFLDGDDLWAADYLEKVLPLLEPGTADILAFHARVVDMAGRSLGVVQSHRRSSDEPGVPAEDLMLDAAGLAEWHCYTRIYRSQLLVGATFPKHRYYEDAAFVPGVYARASRIETLAQELYLYRRRPGSITSAIADRHIDDLLQNVRETGPGMVAGSPFWGIVRRQMALHVAREIGRAPRALRGPMRRRAWAQVAPHASPGLWLRWHLALLDVSLRTELKALLRRPAEVGGLSPLPQDKTVPPDGMNRPCGSRAADPHSIPRRSLP